ncbi:MAG: two-component system NtrC family nitrogen regulation response regulator GlnG [Hyphomonadaceae bacterium]|nr:MAG: two-component system NtrC family nitrogen regulation response regulator GlnG [Hyphomonadaceae bacterium]
MKEISKVNADHHRAAANNRGRMILIADDDASIRTVLSQALTRAGFQVRSTTNAATLWKWVKDGEGDLVLTDVMMPDGSVFEFLPRIRRERPKLPIIVMSAQNTLLTAISAVEQGAYEYLPKPFDLGKMIDLVTRALEPISQHRSESQNRKVLKDKNLPLIGRSMQMQEVYRTISRVSPTDLPIVIQGEVGVGKKLVAQTIHDFSKRKSANFAHFNIAGLEAHELSQTLLGDGKSQIGLLQECDNGTIFIESVDEATSSAQSRLFSLVSSSKTDNIRFIFSATRELGALVRESAFRTDLYHLINIIGLVIPPLRERIDDIGDLARLFIEKASESANSQKLLDKSAIAELANYSWPGNVRELENLMKRMAVLFPDTNIDGQAIAASLAEQQVQIVTNEDTGNSDLSGVAKVALAQLFVQYKGQGVTPHDLYEIVLKAVEKPLFELTLKETKGNQIRAASLLGLNRNTLRKRLTELNLQ